MGDAINSIDENNKSSTLKKTLDEFHYYMWRWAGITDYSALEKAVDDAVSGSEPVCLNEKNGVAEQLFMKGTGILRVCVKTTDDIVAWALPLMFSSKSTLNINNSPAKSLKLNNNSNTTTKKAENLLNDTTSKSPTSKKHERTEPVQKTNVIEKFVEQCSFTTDSVTGLSIVYYKPSHREKIHRDKLDKENANIKNADNIIEDLTSLVLLDPFHQYAQALGGTPAFVPVGIGLLVEEFMPVSSETTSENIFSSKSLASGPRGSKQTPPNEDSGMVFPLCQATIKVISSEVLFLQQRRYVIISGTGKIFNSGHYGVFNDLNRDETENNDASSFEKNITPSQDIADSETSIPVQAAIPDVKEKPKKGCVISLKGIAQIIYTISPI
ncbi:MAG: hypothetical protein QW728_07745 [Thermoplasmata archaeon]